MKIYKVLNNNVASVLDENGDEVILVGKGIAYNKKSGDMIDKTLVDKKFLMEDNGMNEKFKQILIDIPVEHIELASNIIDYAEISTDKKFNESIYISLSDHLSSSIQRFLDGISIKNAMLWDIRHFYEPEFEVGMKALDMVEEKFKIRLPEDEAAFIAIHFVDATLDQSSIENVYEITKIINDISNIVKYYFGINFNQKSVYYYRFITHLRFFAQRLVTKTTYDDNLDNKLFKIMKEQYSNSYECVKKIENYIIKNYDYNLNDEEKLYLTIHIERIVYKTDKS